MNKNDTTGVVNPYEINIAPSYINPDTGTAFGTTKTGETLSPIIPKQTLSEIGMVSSSAGADLVNKAQITEQRLTPQPTEASTEVPKPEPTKGQYSFEEAVQLFGNDFTGVNQTDDGKYVADSTALSRAGIKTDATLPQNVELERDQAQADADIAKLRNFSAEMANDPALASILNTIIAQWEARIKETQESNASRSAAISTAGVRFGSRYAGGNAGPMAGIISAEERAGASRIDSLINQKNTALAEAKSAYEQKKWDKYVKLVDLSEKKLAETKQAVAELNKVTLAENQKRQDAMNKQIADTKEQNRLFSIEAGVSDALSAGEMDINKVYRNLVSNGINATSTEVKKAFDNFKMAEKTAPGVIGEWLALKENDPELADITLDEYLSIKDPGRALDLQEQRLRMRKLEKDLTDNGINEDPSNMLAYAQQYASTGQIPTGLPKGTFGLISQVAKELPKSNGSIINKTTGITDSKTPSTEQQDYTRLFNIIQNTKRLKELDEKRIGGLISGTLGKVFGAEDQSKYLATRKAIVDDISRMQSGAALTAEEVAFYEDYLPGRFSEPLGLGQDSYKKIENFEEIMNNRLIERLDSNNLSIVGYSKVKIGNKEYKVGDVVSNGEGQTGRVNADGSITILSE